MTKFLTDDQDPYERLPQPPQSVSNTFADGSPQVWAARVRCRHCPKAVKLENILTPYCAAVNRRKLNLPGTAKMPFITDVITCPLGRKLPERRGPECAA